MSVSAVVPAYNEVPRIARVLTVLLSHSAISEVIVVDDGSTDATSEVAKRSGVRTVIRHEKNRGKGAAMESGVIASQGDIIFFCDADIVGLSHRIIDDILEPVMRGSFDMCIGERGSKVRALGFGLTHTALIDGQRALTRTLWERTPRKFKSHYEIETALNFFAARSPRGYTWRVFNEISQVTKEEKIGLVLGTLSRYRMYWQIVSAQAHLSAARGAGHLVAQMRSSLARSVSKRSPVLT